MRIKKTTLYGTLAIVLAVLLIFSTISNEKIVITGGASADGESIVYLMPLNCQNCNAEMVEDLTKDLGMSVLAYEADFVRAPLVLFPEENKVSMMDASTKSSLAKDLCSTTSDKDLCSLSKSLACEGVAKLDKPNFKLFYMSYCPYGQQAFKSVAQVAELFGNKVEIEPHFVIYENYRGGGDDYCIGDGKLCSMHGIAELNENIREACVYKYDKNKFWDYTLCIMNSCQLSNVGECWETCADEYSIDKDKINTCLDEEGISLMTAERTLDAKYGATGSPTLILNEEKYTGGRAAEDMKTSICCGFKDVPSECSESLADTASQATGSCS